MSRRRDRLTEETLQKYRNILDDADLSCVNGRSISGYCKLTLLMRPHADPFCLVGGALLLIEGFRGGLPLTLCTILVIFPRIGFLILRLVCSFFSS